MIKVFTTDKNGKIHFTADELKKLLDEAYWEGYRANSHTYVYTTPYYNWSPYNYSITCNNADSMKNVMYTTNTSNSDSMKNVTYTTNTINLDALINSTSNKTT